MFTGGNLVVRVPVEILEDKTVETHREEYFFVHVASGLGQPPSIKPVDKPANITIVDNDSESSKNSLRCSNSCVCIAVCAYCIDIPL